MKKRHENKGTQQQKRRARPLASVMAALFGVQSERNRRQDFSQPSPWPYLLAGIVGIGIFVGILVAISLAVTAGH